MILREMWNRVCSLTLIGWMRLLRQRITGKQTHISGTCIGCGECCRLVNLKYSNGWIKNENQFEELIRKNPEYRRFIPAGRDEQGCMQFTCSLLGDDLSCREYEKRLTICRKYPSKSMHLCGGAVPPSCGYSIDEVTPFARYLRDQLRSKRQ